MRCAVIGTGKMGKNHLRTLAGISEVELCAIADLDKETGNQLASEYKVNYFEDYREMIEVEKPVFVSICVPTTVHFEVASYCMRKGIAVLLEKPIAINVEEGIELLNIAKEEGVVFMVGHIERFNPAVKKVKEMIQKGELGKITAVMARRVGGFPPQIYDANIAVDLSIHDIDIVNYLLDEIPQEIVLNGQRNHIERREDSVEFFMKYSYASAYIQTNWITPVKIRKLNITGTEGYLEMDYITQQIKFYKSNYDKFKYDFKGFSDYILVFSEPDEINISVAKKEPLKEEILYFIDCLKNGDTIDCTYAVEALKIALNKEK